MDIKSKINDISWLSTEKNKITVIGEILGIEEEGIYKGKSSFVVLFKTTRDKNKSLYNWVVFENNQKNKEFIFKNLSKTLFIEGYLNVTYSFNNKAVSHTFIVPEFIDVLTDMSIVETELDDFVLSYTINNRIVLEGVIVGDIWREFIEPVSNYVTRFQIEVFIDGKPRKLYCTVWDTVNPISEIKKGMKVRVTGSYTMLKKERNLIYKDGFILESRKNKLDSYVVIVQKLLLINN